MLFFVLLVYIVQTITVKSAEAVRRFLTVTLTSVNGNPSLTRYISYYWAMCRDGERERERESAVF